MKVEYCDKGFDIPLSADTASTDKPANMGHDEGRALTVHILVRDKDAQPTNRLCQIIAAKRHKAAW